MTRTEFLRAQLDRMREETEHGAATQIGITDSRYQRVLNGAEKILRDHAAEIDGDRPWSEVVLWAMDILGVDTDEDGWAPHRERADRMGW